MVRLYYVPMMPKEQMANSLVDDAKRVKSMSKVMYWPSMLHQISVPSLFLRPSESILFGSLGFMKGPCKHF